MGAGSNVRRLSIRAIRFASFERGRAKHMRVIAYVDALDENQLDWIGIRFMTNRGVVTHFTVQYETIVDENRLAVIRFDSVHGFPHIDVLNRRGEVISTESLVGGLPLNLVLDIGVADTRRNWTIYRRRFLGVGE